MPDESNRRRLGRPRKSPSDVRTELVRVYMTPLEHAELTAFAEGCGVRPAELLRLSGLGKDPRYGPSRVDPARRAEESVVVRFRLPLAEKELLDTAARKEGLFLGAFLRKAAFERSGPIITNTEAMRLVYELNAIGNNLNQAVRDAHAGSGRRHDWDALRGELARLLTEVTLRYVR